MPTGSLDGALLATAVISIGLLLAGWVVYPLALLLYQLSERSVGRSAFGATLSCVLATREHPKGVSKRVSNLLQTNYPLELIEVIVAVDCASMHTVRGVQGVLGDRARVVVGDPPGGKAATLNAGVRAARSDIVLLVDTAQSFDPDTIPVLLKEFDTSRFAAVSGTVSLERDDPLMRLYWSYEKLLRRGQAARHGLVTTSGAITALVREQWEALPVGVICDDLFFAVGMAQRGHRVGTAPSAVAKDPRQISRHERFRKKVRTLTGLVQFLRWRPSAMLPWCNPLWIDLMAHKVLRLVTPLLVMAAFVACAWWTVRNQPFVALVAIASALLPLLLVSRASPERARYLVRELSWAASLLAAPILALANGIRGNWDVWRPSDSARAESKGQATA